MQLLCQNNKWSFFPSEETSCRGFTDVTSCPKCPSDVKEEIGEYMLKKKQDKDTMNLVPDFDEYVDENDHLKDISSKRRFTTLHQVLTEVTRQLNQNVSQRSRSKRGQWMCTSP